MKIGIMVMDLLCESSHSLKEKRQVLSSIKERLRNKYNISVIESDYQDLWQKTQLSVVMVGLDNLIIDRTFTQIENLIVSSYPVQPLEISREYI